MENSRTVIRWYSEENGSLDMEREKTEYKDLVRELNTWKYDEKIHRE